MEYSHDLCGSNFSSLKNQENSAGGFASTGHLNCTDSPRIAVFTANVTSRSLLVGGHSTTSSWLTESLPASLKVWHVQIPAAERMTPVKTKPDDVFMYAKASDELFSFSSIWPFWAHWVEGVGFPRASQSNCTGAPSRARRILPVDWIHAGVQTS